MRLIPPCKHGPNDSGKERARPCVRGIPGQGVQGPWGTMLFCFPALRSSGGAHYLLACRTGVLTLVLTAHSSGSTSLAAHFDLSSAFQPCVARPLTASKI